MLVNLFWALLVAGGSAAVVFWVFAAKAGYDVVTASGHAPRISEWALIAFWPFAARSRPDASEQSATSLNKMLVGLFAAILVVAGSAAVYSNLTSARPPQTVQ